jgi:hypothetical protein
LEYKETRWKSRKQNLFSIVLISFGAGAFFSWVATYSVLSGGGGNVQSPVLNSPAPASGTQNPPSKTVLPPKPTTVIPLDSIQHAKEILLGTWTYTQPLSEAQANAGMSSATPNLGGFYALWIRIVFASDHCMLYKAPPVSNSWGKPERCHWMVKTDKSSSTGERYFFVVFDIHPMDYLENPAFDYPLEMILTNQTRGILLGIDLDEHDSVKMIKEDAFPFSK